jgi:hypothetical protein
VEEDWFITDIELGVAPCRPVLVSVEGLPVIAFCRVSGLGLSEIAVAVASEQ